MDFALVIVWAGLTLPDKADLLSSMAPAPTCLELGQQSPGCAEAPTDGDAGAVACETFEPVFAETQPASGRSRPQISDTEKSTRGTPA
jgi:hypothetical protein